MAKENDNMTLTARITFVADKMVKNMKKCLEKKDFRDYVTHPAIEVETGLMIATNGHILAVRKLQDYRCELGEGVLVVNGTRMLPVEVLGMKGTVTVEIMGDGQGNETVRVSDEKGTAEMEQTSRYPNWRSAMPWNAGWAIDVDAKAWGKTLGDMLKAMDKDDDGSQYSVRLYGERGDKTLRMSHYNWNGDETVKQDLGVGQMPYKMFATFAGKRLQTILAFEPTAMRFVENIRPVMFYSADTLMLLMPLLVNDDNGMGCEVESGYCDRFDLEKWLKGEPATAKTAKPKATKAVRAAEIPQHTERAQEPTFAERLREALLKHYKADEGKRENSKATTTVVYKFSQLHQLNDEFDRVFGIGFKPFYNGLVSVASKHLCIDILKFDDWLHKKHGNYEDSGKSMNNCIREHYGDEGVKLINRVS